MENIHVKIPNILKSMEIIGKLSRILVKNLTEMPTGVLEDILYILQNSDISHDFW